MTRFSPIKQKGYVLKTDPDDFETQTVEEYMKDCKSPYLIAGTMYE